VEFPNKGVPLQKSQVQRTLREGLGTMVFPLSDCWVAWNQPFRKKIKIRAARCGVRHAAKCGGHLFFGGAGAGGELGKIDNQIAARRAIVGLDPFGKRT